MQGASPAWELIVSVGVTSHLGNPCAGPSNPSTFVDFQENAMGLHSLHLFFADKMEKETQNFPNSAILKDLFILVQTFGVNSYRNSSGFQDRSYLCESIKTRICNLYMMGWEDMLFQI